MYLHRYICAEVIVDIMSDSYNVNSFFSEGSQVDIFNNWICHVPNVFPRVAISVNILCVGKWDVTRIMYRECFFF